MTATMYLWTERYVHFPDVVNAPITLVPAPDFIDASAIPALNTDIELPTLPTFNVQGFDAGHLPNIINLDGLLQSLDLSDLDLPPTPDAPILNLPDAPSITVKNISKRQLVTLSAHMVLVMLRLCFLKKRII